MILLACFFSFLAGFVDSVVGGGGLIQLPALFVLFPGMPVADVLGTNKLAAVSGTSVAAYRFMRRVPLVLGPVLLCSSSAVVASYLGARAVSLLDPATVKPVILVLLVAVALFTFVRKDFGEEHRPRLSGKTIWIASALLGALLGFYDGFFGPGTGTFLLFSYVCLFGYNFLTASASAKLVNWATNAAALVYFLSEGHVVYELALPMAVTNMLGSMIGTQLALAKGSRFIRVLFLVIVSAMIIRFALDLLPAS